MAVMEEAPTLCMRFTRGSLCRLGKSATLQNFPRRGIGVSEHFILFVQF